MRKVFRILVLIVWIAGLAGHGVADGGTNDLWFNIGEELNYRGYWGVLPVGDVKIWTESVAGHPDRIAIRMKATSWSIVSALFPVEDFIESVVDIGTFLPVTYAQHLSEGGRLRDDITTFSHDQGKAVCVSERKGSTNTTKVLEIASDTRDVLCLMYYMRAKGLGVGGNEHFKVLVDDKLYDLSITGLKSNTVYLSQFGDVRCLELEPKAKFGEVFVRKGTMKMWFSDDASRICAKAEAIVPVANIRVLLRSAVNTRDGFWTGGKRKGKR